MGSRVSTLIGILILPMMLRASPPAAKQAVRGEAGTVGRVVDAGDKLSFMPPAGWKRDNSHPPYIIFSAPREPDESVNISIVSGPVGNQTLEQFTQHNRDTVLHNKGLTIYAEQNALLAGEKAHSWRMHLQPPLDKGHENRQIFCVHNRRWYLLTLTALPSNLSKYEPVFDKMAASLRWER